MKNQIIVMLILSSMVISVMPITQNANGIIVPVDNSNLLDYDYSMGNEYNNITSFVSADFYASNDSILPDNSIKIEDTSNAFYSENRFLRDENYFFKYTVGNLGEIVFMHTTDLINFKYSAVLANGTDNLTQSIYWGTATFYENGIYYLYINNENNYNIHCYYGTNPTNLTNLKIVQTSNAAFTFYPLNMYKINNTYYLFTYGYYTGINYNEFVVFYGDTLFNLSNKNIWANSNQTITTGEYREIDIYEWNNTYYIHTSYEKANQGYHTFHIINTSFSIADFDNYTYAANVISEYGQIDILPIGRSIIMYYYSYLWNELYFVYLSYEHNTIYLDDNDYKSGKYKMYPFGLTETANVTIEGSEFTGLFNHFNFELDSYEVHSDYFGNKTFYNIPVNNDIDTVYYFEINTLWIEDYELYEDILIMNVYTPLHIVTNNIYSWYINNQNYSYYHDYWLEYTGEKTYFSPYRSIVFFPNKENKNSLMNHDIVNEGESLTVKIKANPDNLLFPFLSSLTFTQQIGIAIMSTGIIILLIGIFYKDRTILVMSLAFILSGAGLIDGAGVLSGIL